VQAGMGTDAHQADGAELVGDSDKPERRRLPATAFRSRRSALSGAQRETWERLWPELGMAELGGPNPKESLDTDAWFGRRAPLVLEIGCGSGTSTLAMAKNEPGIDVIAVEIYRRGLAQLLCAIERTPRAAGKNVAAKIAVFMRVGIDKATYRAVLRRHFGLMPRHDMP